MSRRPLSHTKLKSLKPAEPGSRYEVPGDVPGFAVRVTDSGVKTFVLNARFPGSKWGTRRALGTFPDMTLERARDKAILWRQWIKEGKDPAVVEEEARQAELRRRADTFKAAAEAFIAHTHADGQRQADKVERDLRNVFIRALGDRPVTAITSVEIRTIIEAKKKEGKLARAHNLLELISRCFNWIIDTDSYGLTVSPCARLKPKKVVGEKKKRKRVLNDDELRAFWAATGRMDYPSRQFLRLLLVTIQRKSEVSDAAWPEFNLDKPYGENGEGPVWIIPDERMKMGEAHAVPLSPLAVDILREAPAFTQGEAVFSYTFGRKPLNCFSAVKRRLDALMVDELRKAAAERGEDPEKVTLAPWVLHDLRRTGRTHLSALPIPDLIRERIIAHKPSVLHQTYDLFEHLEEKRRGLDLWAARLLAIVEPRQEVSNVAYLKSAACGR